VLRLTTYHLHEPTVLKSWNLNLLEASGLSRLVIGLLYVINRYTIICKMSIPVALPSEE
jgi:hypothetical protein